MCYISKAITTHEHWQVSEYNVLSTVCSAHTFKCNMYYSFIYPYLTYGSTLQAYNYCSHIYEVVKLQNKTIRVLNNVPITDNITPHYVNLSILKFPDTVKLTFTSSLISSIISDHPILQHHFYHNIIAILHVMSLQNNYIFPFQNKHHKFLSHNYWTLFLERSSLSIHFKSTKKLLKNSLFIHYL